MPRPTSFPGPVRRSSSRPSVWRTFVEAFLEGFPLFFAPLVGAIKGAVREVREVEARQAARRARRHG